MLFEMHCHTHEHSSCSYISAVDLVQYVYSKHLQGIVITDHHYRWPESELLLLKKHAGTPDHFLIMSGQEVKTSDFGDVLVYGVDVSLKEGITLQAIIKKYPSSAVIWAHPYRKNKIPSEHQLSSPFLDGIEIFSSNYTVRENYRGLRDWHKLKFTAVAGTDTHGYDYAGIYPTQFDHPVTNILELAQEIKKGRCRPFFKEIPKAGSNALVTEVTIGTKGEDEVRQKIIIRKISSNKKWEKADRSFHIMKELVRCGFKNGVYRVPRAIDEDPESMTLIEQGLRGKLLYEKLIASNYKDGRKFIELSARWLARLHNCRLCITPVSDFIEKEKERLKGYVERFTKASHPHTRKAEAIAEETLLQIEQIDNESRDSFIQGHGDYHPKNIIIGQDNTENKSTLFISAIDFENSYCLPPAFDVGYFLAQFRHQFFHQQEIIKNYPEEIFINAYLKASESINEHFFHYIEIFRARTNLNIAAYLIKLDLSKSRNLWRLLIEAEQALAACSTLTDNQVYT